MAKKETEFLDPIAYREDYPKDAIIGYDPMADLTPEYLENMDYGKEIKGANESFNQYGDDSSSKNQLSSKGGLNEKFTGEGVKNDQLNYDANLMLKDLNPNFVYGLASKVYGTDHPGYITQRNDQIASALYNEGKTSKDDVAYFLGQQKGWSNSSEEDRSNTIEAIYKRLGAIGEQNPKAEEKTEDKKEQENPDLIFGKTTADEGNPKNGIVAGTDANIALNQMEQWRRDNLNTMLTMSPQSIAAALETGSIPESMQVVRDYQLIYPELWAEVQNERKKIQGQKAIDAITKGEEMPSNTNTVSSANNGIAQTAADITSNTNVDASMADVLKDIHQTLQSNANAQGASATMDEIESEIAELNKRLGGLREEANTVFKGDVPDYIVNAYINNRTQEIQDKLKVLSERYKYASNRYDKEVANAQWEKEYDLKERQVKVQEETLELNKQKNSLGISTDVPSYSNPTTTTSLSGRELPMTTHTRSEIGSYIDQLVDMYNNGQIGNAQCGVGVQTYYLPFLGVSFGSISNRGDKLGIRNEGRDYMPQKGDLIIMASGTKPGNGHMGIVIGMTEDGKIQYLDWNGDKSGDEKPAIREIDPNSAKIQGYYNATKGQNEASTNEDGSLSGWQFYEGNPFNIDYIPYYEKVINAKYTSQGGQAADAANLGLTNDEFRKQAYTYKAAKASGMLDVNDPLLREGGKWVGLNGKTYDLGASSAYKKLSDKDKKGVLQLLNNQKQFSSMTTNRTDYDSPASILAAVQEIDPEWSETWYSNRQKAENKRATSEMGGYISSNKTAMSRARDIYELADTLEDQSRSKVSKLLKGNNIRTLKDLVNWKEEETGNVNVTRLKTAVDTFINEYAKALKGGNASNAVEDVMREQEIFNLGLSQEQLKVAMEEAAKALYEKDVTEIADLKKYTFLKQEVTWLEEDADWLYDVVGVPLDKYYNYTPKGGVNPYEDKNEETTTTTSGRFNLSNLFHNS